jgi:radical SAM superfamily enzyme YgiQ (UPF0313 family)
MRITFVHPCIGRRIGQPYLRTWQMEPLAPATLAGLTPRGGRFDIRFYDDRNEAIPFDEPTDLVAMSVETYSAKRAYQIASEFRRRKVPVVMGGFHPTLVPDEVTQYAESIVIGEAEELWPLLLDDFCRGHLKPVYRQAGRPSLAGVHADRSIFAGKRYLKIKLVEAGRGCQFGCEFCSVQSFFHRTHARRPINEIVDEVRGVKDRLIFFVDDNVTTNSSQAKEFLRALVPLKIRWVSQGSINAGHDEEFLRLLKASGCQALLIGFESLDDATLKKMNKQVNTMRGGYEEALANLRRFGIRIYATFVFGYDGDRQDSFRETLAFANRHRFYLAGFNHLVPFPGTPLYRRLQEEGRLLYERWWLDPRYRFGMVPYAPQGMTADEVRARCAEARREFFSFKSILNRGLDMKVNGGRPSMWLRFFTLNILFRAEIDQRLGFPLGDESYTAPLVKARHSQPLEASHLVGV